MKKQELHVVENWPAHSPDLNPIENYWAILKKTLGPDLDEQYMLENNDENRVEIWNALLRAAATVNGRNHDTFPNLHESFESRLKQCVEKKGEALPY